MAFKFPSLRDIPTFKWSDLTEKEEIGKGSFGAVFAAKYASDGGSTVVIKKLLGVQEEDKRRFLKEAIILHGLKNKNIVGFKAFCDTPCSIMLEYLCFDFSPFQDGGHDKVNCLDDFLHYLDSENAVDEFPFHMKIASNISLGVAYLHDRGLAHRDLKPANILVSNNHYSGLQDSDELQRICMSEPIVCKLTDFGESRSEATQTATMCNTATNNVHRGSPVYMAPEIFSEDELATPATMDDLK